MEYYAIYLPYKEAELSIKSFYNDKEEALKVLKSHKEARLKAFRTSEEAVYFYLNGPAEPVPQAAPKSPTNSSPSSKFKLEKTPFKVPKSQELVAFRKNIEKNELDMVRNIIQLNPRYLVNSGDMPTILKEGPRYNALHVAAMEGNTDMCRLILETIDKSSFIEHLHGQRNPSTEEVSAILLDMYLNMPDKCRSETPLHFAAKYGSVGVVEILISYPQCKLTKNSDGYFPKDIICSRAKSKNNTPEIKKAIEDLFQDRFFVPVLRAVDNSTPPVVGDPFTITNPPNLEAKDKFSPQLAIKAYAGPMDKEKAHIFCKRWKTPPRLIPSPKFISPVKSLSSSKIPISSAAGGVLSPLSSTPIATKKGRRSLFPNKSFELALDQDEQERNNSINNNFDIEVVKEDVDLEELEEQKQDDDLNGNSLQPPKTIGGIRMSPVKKPGEVGNFLFRRYRERLQNSFATIYDDDDDEEKGMLNDTREGFNELDAVEKSIGNAEGNFNYFCDENNSFYEGTNITESPSFKERKLRVTDTEKGLEMIGRNLAEDHDVGWNEYWNFLGAFANLKRDDGIQLLENYLLKQQQNSELLRQQTVEEQLVLPLMDLKKRALIGKTANDSLGSICDAFDKLTLVQGAEAGKASQMVTATPKANHLAEPEPMRSKITNPYVCLHNSLQVFAKRFVKHLDESSTMMSTDFSTFFQQAVVDSVRKLNTLVDNYRKDAAFGAIDFSKVHSRYSQLIVINIEQQGETSEGVIHRLKVLLDKSREVNSARKYPELHDSLVCLQNFLDFYILKKLDLMQDCQGETSLTQTETSCSQTWKEDPLIHSCNCRIDGAYAKKGSMERLNKRREQRKKAAFKPVDVADAALSSSVAPDFQSYRASRTVLSDKSDDDNEEYFSCSDSDSDDGNDSFETPPSSPSFFSEQLHKSGGPFDFSSFSTDEGTVSDENFLDSKPDVVAGADLADESTTSSMEPFSNFIEGKAPTKQDVDVLNVIENCMIDATRFPCVFEWRKAMQMLSPKEKERLSSVIHKPRWRSSAQCNATAVTDLSNVSSTAGGSSPPGTPITSVSKMFRLGSTASSGGGNNDSVSSLNARLTLMNISDYTSKQQIITPASSS